MHAVAGDAVDDVLLALKKLLAEDGGALRAQLALSDTSGVR